jgi:hypothetical protein
MFERMGEPKKVKKGFGASKKIIGQFIRIVFPLLNWKS